MYFISPQLLVLTVIGTFMVVTTNARRIAEVSPAQMTELTQHVAEVVDVLFNNHTKRNCSEPSVPGKWIFKRTVDPDVKIVRGKIYFQCMTTLDDAKVIREVKRSDPDDLYSEECYLVLLELNSARVNFKGFVDVDESKGCFVKTTTAKLLPAFSWEILEISGSAYENLSEDTREKIKEEIKQLINKPHKLKKFADDFGPRNGETFPVVFDCTQSLRDFVF